MFHTRLVTCHAGGTLRRDIPTVGSIMAFFNKELLYSCKDDYVEAMEKLLLPVDVQKLDQWHRTAATAAYAHFDKQKFGNEMLSMSGTLRDALQEAIDKEYMCGQITLANQFDRELSSAAWTTTLACDMLRSKKTANEYASSGVCEKLETACEDLLESEGRMRLPSLGRFKCAPSETVIARRLALQSMNADPCVSTYPALDAQSPL